TGVYCRPSCAGRPLPRNRSFLPSPAAARRAGYRACKRCHPDGAVAADLGFLGPRAVAGIEEVVDGAYRRTLRDGSILSSRDDSPLARQLLDADADLLAVNSVLAADPLLAPLVAASPARRVPGHVDGFEMAVRAILGQQVSVAAARTHAARLVARYGSPLAAADGSLTHAWPSPAALRDAEIAGPRTRGAAIRALAAAVDDGEVDLSFGASAEPLLALPGVGPWTASYVAMRALGDRDAFLPTDLGVRRGLEKLGVAGDPRSAEQLAERWRPFRSYAVQHLWAVAA
ncbi:MAG TPA: AlkA N-terminal domain-containing protein, partial [Solirubrobacteraceae bacterium]|nr:AlkA N-terminal domain-containing protein [Solirubrobacteraceae bacterium]